MRGLARLAEAAAVIWLAVTLAFFALQVLPGDAALESLSVAGVSPAIIEARRSQLGLGAAPLEQYLRYMAGLASGSLGVSLLDGRPVAETLGQPALATFGLTFAAGLITLAAGVPLGIWAARHGWGGLPGRAVLGLLVSVPILWTGTLVLATFGFSASGQSDLLLPALVLGLSGAGALGLVTERALAETQAQPFIRTARAKGLPERLIMERHVLRASASPILTVFVLQIGFLLSGALLTEALFNRPGIGRLLVQAALRQDYPVVLGVVVWSAICYSGLLLIGDVLARWLDPRMGRAD
ncbi:MAG: ABC transporter permease [Anaerolineae bacterium]|nr:ABC transporter permease [Anaerolineae bacterium]